MLVFGRDSSECQGNPSNFRQRDQENCISEFCRLREVDRSRTRVTTNEGKLRVRARNKVGIPCR